MITSRKIDIRIRGERTVRQRRPSKEDIAGLVKNLAVKAKRLLTTGKSVAQFLLEISAALRPPV